VLADTGAGVQLVDQPSLERQLVEWWHEIEQTGAVRWRGNAARLERYSQLGMARRFARVLDEVVNGRPEMVRESQASRNTV